MWKEAGESEDAYTEALRVIAEAEAKIASAQQEAAGDSLIAICSSNENALLERAGRFAFPGQGSGSAPLFHALARSRVLCRTMFFLSGEPHEICQAHRPFRRLLMSDCRIIAFRSTGRREQVAASVQPASDAPTMRGEMAKEKQAATFEVACPDCGAMLIIDAATGLVVSHTSAPRKRMFEDLETAAQAMRAQEERKESIFRQSVDAEKNKADLLEKKFAEALRKAKDAPEGKPLREFDLD